MSEQKIEEFWRDATAEDVAKVMRVEKVEARFRDQEHESWCIEFLLGWAKDEGRDWVDSGYNGWRLCQVYDPPQWFLDKPDPGEGWRLLEKFPPEELQPEDDWWGLESKDWLPSRRACRGEQQDHDVWYRRRIEPNVPEIPDSSRSKDYIPSGWVKLSDDEPRLASDAYWSQVASEWCLIGEDRVNFANRSKWPAIRQAFNQMRTLLVADCCYCLPNGQKIRTTEKGFEVL